MQRIANERKGAAVPILDSKAPAAGTRSEYQDPVRFYRCSRQRIHRAALRAFK